MKFAEHLPQILAAYKNQKFDDFSPLSGGDINEVYRVPYGDDFVVVKINHQHKFPKMLEKEALALRYYHNKVDDSHYPQPLKWGEVNNVQFLILKYIDPSMDKTNVIGQEKLGELLAKQHRVSNNYFGWEYDNYIGSLKQKNTKHSSWSLFYAENRLLVQSRMAYDANKLNLKEIKGIEKLCLKLSSIFPVEQPSLLHGDLWGGNYFLTKEYEPFLYDPAIYFGHREMDIGMTQLFGGFSQAFINTYNQNFPLEKGWEDRLIYSQLYPNLVHLNLFGESYHNCVYRAIQLFC